MVSSPLKQDTIMNMYELAYVHFRARTTKSWVSNHGSAVPFRRIDASLCLNRDHQTMPIHQSTSYSEQVPLLSSRITVWVRRDPPRRSMPADDRLVPFDIHDHIGSLASKGVVSAFASDSSRLAIVSLMNDMISKATLWGIAFVLLMVSPSCWV